MNEKKKTVIKTTAKMAIGVSVHKVVEEIIVNNAGRMMSTGPIGQTMFVIGTMCLASFVSGMVAEETVNGIEELIDAVKNGNATVKVL